MISEAVLWFRVGKRMSSEAVVWFRVGKRSAELLKAVGEAITHGLHNVLTVVRESDVNPPSRNCWPINWLLCWF